MRGPGRRDVLRAGGLLAVASALGAGTVRAAATSAGLQGADAGRLRAWPTAMHVHASQSEGMATHLAQLQQASLNRLTGVWFTEHDWRRDYISFTQRYSFAPGETHFGRTWVLTRVGQGPAEGGGGIVSDPTSPHDPTSPKGSLRLSAVSAGAGVASLRFAVDARARSRMNYSGSIAGRRFSIDVLLSQAGADAWAEASFPLSHWPATGALQEGQYTVVYRFAPEVPADRWSAEGTTGTVHVAVPVGTWTTVRLDFLADLARLWPAMPDARDNALPPSFELRATSRRRARAECFFANFQAVPDASYDALGTQAALLARYRRLYPEVFAGVGTELSFGPHLNQYGGAQAPYDYGTTELLTPFDTPTLSRRLVRHIHDHGGLASINHPFGSGDAEAGSSGPAQVARGLLVGGGAGADIIEVGFKRRSGGDARAHLDVWDALSRNGMRLTGVGATDDHVGRNLARADNRYYTAPWASANREGALLAALAAGRAFAGYLGRFSGTLDCWLDDVPMGGGGSASSARAASRRGRYRVDATGLPPDAVVQVRRGVVDRPGTSDPTSNSAVAATLRPSDFAQGWAVVAVDTSDPVYLRTEVVDPSTGDVLAFGQPSWSSTTRAG